jgi:hypothetical protein
MQITDECPFGHELGEDFDMFEDCKNCEFYTECEILSDEGCL